MQLPIRSFFDSLDYKSILSLAVLFALALVLQLRISSRARRWTLDLVHALIFGGAFFGLLLLFIVILIKYKFNQQKRMRQQL